MIYDAVVSGAPFNQGDIFHRLPKAEFSMADVVSVIRRRWEPCAISAWFLGRILFNRSSADSAGSCPAGERDPYNPDL